MINYILLFSRQGKLRLQKWNITMCEKQKKKVSRELIQMVLARRPKHCNFIDYKDYKVCYKRYASLYFLCAIEPQDNELLCLEMIHRYVELLDKYFGSVCELDIIFNFEKAYFILDEFILGESARYSVLGIGSEKFSLSFSVHFHFISCLSTFGQAAKYVTRTRRRF